MFGYEISSLIERLAGELDSICNFWISKLIFTLWRGCQNNWNLPFMVSRSVAYLSRNYEIL